MATCRILIWIDDGWHGEPCLYIPLPDCEGSQAAEWLQRLESGVFPKHLQTREALGHIWIWLSFSFWDHCHSGSLKRVSLRLWSNQCRYCQTLSWIWIWEIPWSMFINRINLFATYNSFTVIISLNRRLPPVMSKETPFLFSQYIRKCKA